MATYLTAALFSAPETAAVVRGYIRDSVASNGAITQTFVSTALETLAAGHTLLSAAGTSARFAGAYSTTEILDEQAPAEDYFGGFALVGTSLYYSTGAAWVSPSGGSVASAWADLTDKATATLPTDNTPLATALAGKVPVGSFVSVSADRTVSAADNNIVASTGSTSRAFTVPAGLAGSFIGLSVYGPCTWAGSGGASIAVEDRPTGKGYNFCQLIRVATDAYIVVGARA